MAKKSSRDKLLDATLKEIGRFGYFEASTTEILKRSKLPKGVMYHYFDSKRSLVLATVKERVALRVTEFFKSDNKTLFEIVADFENPDNTPIEISAFHKLLVEIGRDDREFRDELENIYQEIKLSIDKAIKESEIKSIDTVSLSSTILNLLFGGLATREGVSSEFLETLLKGSKKKESPNRKTRKRVKKIVQKSLF
jgi:AcrR family transcriptional regulator